MKRLLKIYLFALLALLTGCGHSEDEPEQPSVEPPVVEEEPGGVIDASESGVRTVLVYMVADNTLGSVNGTGFDAADLEEMRAVVADGVLDPGERLLVYYNRRGTASGNPPTLFEITAEGDVDLLTYTDDPTIHSTHPERMEQVLDDMRRVAPAESYGLVLWSHGSGWAENPKQRTFGDDRGVKMDIPSLGRVLNGQGLDFIYFDCCYMATVEVMYELRHSAPVIVASVAELPADGMRYDLNIPMFFADEPDMVGAARATFEYYDSQQGSARTCTMSVIDTEALTSLAESTRQIMLTGALPGMEKKDYQYFYRQSDIEQTLFDMEQYVTTLSGVSPSLIEQWQTAFDRAVVYAEATPKIFNRITINHYGGLTCNILYTAEDALRLGYNNLQWWTDVVSLNPNYQTH